MTRRLRFLPEVAQDLRVAWSWYEDRQPGLGDSLFEVLEAAYERILDAPAAYPRVLDEVRRFPLERFPYSVFYLVETEGEVVVLAIHHQARNPSRWQRRAPDANR